MIVNAHISDLFFNRNLSHCQDKDENQQFAGWKTGMLYGEASTFLVSLRGFADTIGGTFFCPSIKDIVDDFLARV